MFIRNTITAFLLFSIASFCYGHTLGQSLEKEVNGYLVDVGYSAVDKIFTGETIRFDFNLWMGDKSDIADFTHVWVRIAPEEEGISFAGFLYRPELLLTGMSYTFEKAGKYQLTVRFIDNQDSVLAEASFPLEVADSGPGFTLKMLIIGAVGALIGAGITNYLVRRKNQQVNLVK